MKLLHPATTHVKCNGPKKRLIMYDHHMAQLPSWKIAFWETVEATDSTPEESEVVINLVG